MGSLKLTRDGVTLAQIPVSKAAPSSKWPFTVAEPVLPTGLTRRSAYSNTQNASEYVGMSPGSVNLTAKKVVFRDCKLGYVNITEGAEDVWIVGGEIGPMGGGTHPAIAAGFQPVVAKRVVLDGVRIHGMHQGTIDDHTEGLQVGGVDTLIIRNCLFDDNHVFNLFVRCWSPATIRYVLIEDNELKPTSFVNGGSGTYSMRVAGDGDSTKPSDVVIRRNRYPKGQPISVDATAVRVALGAGADANIPI